MDQRHVEISGEWHEFITRSHNMKFYFKCNTPEGIYNTIVGHDFINRISWYEVLPNS